MKFRFFLGFSLVFFLKLSPVLAQITPNFKADTTSGCAPLTVNFTDQSTGSITSRIWSFGNGNTESGNKTSVSALYYDPGTYTVTLTISNGTTTKSTTKTITVFKNPVAKFSGFPLKGCVDMFATFTDESDKGNKGIKTWTWNFGDGVQSNSKNPVHQYTLPSNYPVSLQVTDSNGCSASILKTAYVNVTQKPFVGFSSPLRSSCSVPFTPTFKNNSTGNGKLSYLWRFGDGGTSTDSIPNYSYNTIGSYKVTLIASDANGCTDSSFIGSYIQIASISASFSMANDSACKGSAVFFSNTSSGASTYLWRFGDGTTSTSFNPTKIYSTPGLKTVTLIASRGSSCVDSVKHDIYIDEINGAFTEDKHYACKLPFQVQFTDQTPGAVWWKWNFGGGQGDTSRIANPLKNYGEGLFTDSLFVRNKLGCRDTVVKVNNINVPLLHPSYSMDKRQGCAPLNVNFTNLSSPADTIVSYSWNFGDSFTSTLKDPSHSFTPEGSYKIKLTVTNSHGCSEVYEDSVKVGLKPVADFTYDKDTVCGGETGVQFTDLSTPTNKIDEWIWSVDMNAKPAGGSQSKNPFLSFPDTGWVNVQLISGYNGCYDTIVKKKIIRVFGPIVSYVPSLTCDKPYDRLFSATIIDATGYTWNFGDGTSVSNVNNVTHTYPDNIKYNTELRAFNSVTGCVDTLDKIPVRIRDVKGNVTISPITEGCAPLLVSLDTTNTQDIERLNDFHWYFGDGRDSIVNTFLQPHKSKVSYTYRMPGTFNINLIVRDEYGCADTSLSSVTVHRPIAGFTSNPTSGCSPLTANYIDTTIVDKPLDTWEWSWGDGTSSTTQNATHTHTVLLSNSTKDFTVKLVVTDILGCKDSAEKIVTVTSLNANFFTTNPTRNICVGVPVSLFPFAPVGVPPFSFKWKFGDGDSSLTRIPLAHPYADSGSYKVSLEVSQGGCTVKKDSVAFIKVQRKPIADFTIQKAIVPGDTLHNLYGGLNSKCYPSTVVLKDSSVSPYINFWNWSLGLPGAVSGIANPTQTFVKPGLYDISLIIKTTFNCADTTLKSQYVKVEGPEGDFSINSSPACKGAAITFPLTGVANAYNFTWDFGDGTVVMDQMNPTHYYHTTGTKIVSMAIFNADSTCPQVRTNPIIIHDLTADFTPNTLTGCMPLTVNFSDNSTSTSIGWDWKFDGSNATSQNSQHTFNNSGLYNVSLDARDVNGCHDTAYKMIQVYSLPSVQVQNEWICQDSSVQLTALPSGSLSYTYSWSPNTYIDIITKLNPIVFPKQKQDYTIVVTDENSCTTSNTVTVDVRQKPVFQSTRDTTVIIGEKTHFNSYIDQGYSYSWTPFEGLSCTDCPDPNIFTLKPKLYKVVFKDTLKNCFMDSSFINIDIKKAYTVDVPGAFSPNGDGNNEIAFVRGWGIKRLLEFKIFNRWGQLIFVSNDLQTGWDGTFQGEPQNMDSYAYTVLVETYEGTQLSKKGVITLLR